MSSPRYWWWGSVRNALRIYPKLKERYELPEVALTARYGERSGQNASSRTTETTALDRMGDGDYKVYRAIKAAVEETSRMETGRERLKIIELIYWKRYWKTIEGAAYEVGYSKDRAKELHTEFIRLVGYHLGYISHEKVAKKRNVTSNSQKNMRK